MFTVGDKPKGAISDDAGSADRGIVACLGVARWKQRAIGKLLAEDDGRQPTFCNSTRKAIALAKRHHAAIAVWPSRAPVDFARIAAGHAIPLVHIEDGFLRSNGLGAECRQPLSIVADWSGPHFDPHAPSDLEAILSGRRFEPQLLARSERLVASIVRLGLTKYNLTAKDDLPASDGRRTVLVAGQVEDDLSFRLGGGDISSNLMLLRRARELEPHARILYKPHPDVEAGLRRGGYPDAEVLRLADMIVRDVAVPTLLQNVDAVHVLTSLIGFEALLRGREVIVHGLPFYAGWGLTEDRVTAPRRGRSLSIAELAAAALILYPRYFDPVTGRRCSVEKAIELLSAGAGAGKAGLPALRRIQGWTRKAFIATRAA